MKCPNCQSENNDTQQTCLRKQGVLVLILFTIITFGINIPYWFIKRKEEFNSLNSKEKLTSGILNVLLGTYLADLVIFIILVIIYLAADSIQDEITSILLMLLVYVINLSSGLINMAGLIILCIQAFKVRRILQDHFSFSENPIQISGLGTFLFTVYYLQYKINRL